MNKQVRTCDTLSILHMKFEFNWLSVSEDKMFENVDKRSTDAGMDAQVIGILLAQP